MLMTSEIDNFLHIFSKPECIGAHRGDRSRRPENTLSALKSALGRCDFAEIDIRLTKDRRPVIIHDATLTRTSNVAEIARFADRAPYYVNHFTLEELKTLDVGSWFYVRDPFGTIRNGRISLPPIEERIERIMTLEEALLFSKRHHLFLNLEIKRMHETIGARGIVAIVHEAIASTQSERMVLLSSFDHDYMKASKKMAPHIPTALLRARRVRDPLALLRATNADAWHPSVKIASQAQIRSLREHAYFVSVYVVNDIAIRKRLFEWGVNAIFTDFL